MENQPKKARLELRSTDYQKSVIETAASLVGESVTSYILSTVMDASHKVIRQHKTTELTVRDWERFNDILTDASEPNDELKTALREYESRVST